MYKLLLVDDDKALLESFYKFIDWNEYGFEVVARLCDGVEVLQYIEDNPVDVVITDIRMPIMDGIELAGKLYKSYPDIKIVFVSAFCDFGYARQAIKYKVVDYISKPVLREDVEDILRKLYESLEADNDDETATDGIITERRELFSKLLSGAMTDFEIFKEELAGVQIFYHSLYSKCAVAVYEIMGMERQLSGTWKQDKNKLIEGITNAVCVDTSGHYAVLLDFSDNMLTVLYLSKDGEPISKKKCTDDLSESLYNVYKLMAVNETFLAFDSLGDFKEELMSAKSTEMKYLKNKIEVHSDEQMIYEVERYVNKHYSEDISIKVMAKRYHFNERHFGDIFKKVKGISFFDYLNEVRIEKAKKMLRTDESIEAISKQAGFGSRRNFDRQFLATTGETPVQYRKIRRRENNEERKIEKS